MSYQRRKVRVGRVVGDKMDKTCIVEVEWRSFHRMYKKSIRRRTRFKAHDENNAAQLGDMVSIIESRPMSKTKRWRLVEIVERRETADIAPEDIGLIDVEEVATVPTKGEGFQPAPALEETDSGEERTFTAEPKAAEDDAPTLDETEDVPTTEAPEDEALDEEPEGVGEDPTPEAAEDVGEVEPVSTDDEATPTEDTPEAIREAESVDTDDEATPTEDAPEAILESTDEEKAPLAGKASAPESTEGKALPAGEDEAGDEGRPQQ